MSVIQVESIKNIKVYSNVFYRKKGTTAFVYKKDNNEVLKVFRDTPRKRLIFHTRDMLSTLERLSDIELSSFVTPNDIYIDPRLNVLGYTMDRIIGTRTDKIDALIDMKNILLYAKQLDEDVKALSDTRFKLLDLHEKNMYLSDDGYKLFDLDSGYFSIEEAIDKIHYHNNKQVKQTVIKGLFGIKSYHDIYIRDIDIWESYCNDSVSGVIETIQDKININGINAQDVKKLSKSFVEVYDAYNPIHAYF